MEFPFWPFIGSEHTPIRLPANPSISYFVPGLSRRLATALPGSRKHPTTASGSVLFRATDHRQRFPEVRLGVSRRMRQRPEHLPLAPLPQTHVILYDGLSTAKSVLFSQSFVDSFRGVALLPGPPILPGYLPFALPLDLYRSPNSRIKRHCVHLSRIPQKHLTLEMLRETGLRRSAFTPPAFVRSGSPPPPQRLRDTLFEAHDADSAW